MLKIIADSACDIPQYLIDQYQITRIPFSITFNQADYLRELQDISVEEFYHQLTTSKIFPKTSQPTIIEYTQVFEPIVAAGDDILCITLSSIFSGSFQSATSAANIMKESYPDRNIYVFDSKEATGGEGMLVLLASELVKAGLPLNEILPILEDARWQSRIFFTVDTLEYLQKGGRIGKASALAGNILSLKPILQLKYGELHPVATVRGLKKAYQRIIDEVQSHFQEEEKNIQNYDFILCHGPNPKDLEAFSENVSNQLGITFKYPPFQIGATIGTYTGPGGIGIVLLPSLKSYIG